MNCVLWLLGLFPKSANLQVKVRCLLLFDGFDNSELI